MVGRNRQAWLIAVAVVMGCAASVVAQDARVAELIEQLKSPDAGIRGRAAISLDQLGAAAKPAIPALATALADKNLNVRYWCAKVLRGFGPEAKEAVPALVAALRTFPGGSPALDGPERYYPDVRSVAAEALGAIGPAAKDAVPALKEAAADKSPDVREAAAQAIRRIEAK
jgi:HEAT repeat protein